MLHLRSIQSPRLSARRSSLLWGGLTLANFFVGIGVRNGHFTAFGDIIIPVVFAITLAAIYLLPDPSPDRRSFRTSRAARQSSNVDLFEVVGILPYAIGYTQGSVTASYWIVFFIAFWLTISILTDRYSRVVLEDTYIVRWFQSTDLYETVQEVCEPRHCAKNVGLWVMVLCSLFVTNLALGSWTVVHVIILSLLFLIFYSPAIRQFIIGLYSYSEISSYVYQGLVGLGYFWLFAFFWLSGQSGDQLFPLTILFLGGVGALGSFVERMMYDDEDD